MKVEEGVLCNYKATACSSLLCPIDDDVDDDNNNNNNNNNNNKDVSTGKEMKSSHKSAGRF